MAAAKASAADNAARRAVISSALIDDVERLRDQLFAPAQVYNFGGKDNTFAVEEINEPSFRDKQAIATTIGIFLQRSLELERFDSDGGRDEAALDEWLRTVLGRKL